MFFFFSISTYHYIHLVSVINILDIYHHRYNSHTSTYHCHSRLRAGATSWQLPVNPFLNGTNGEYWIRSRLQRHDRIEPIMLHNTEGREVEQHCPIENRHFRFGGTNPTQSQTFLVRPVKDFPGPIANGTTGPDILASGLGWLICTTSLVPHIPSAYSRRTKIDQARNTWRHLERDHQSHSSVGQAWLSRSPTLYTRGCSAYGYKIRAWRFCSHCQLPAPLPRRPRRRERPRAVDGLRWTADIVRRLQNMDVQQMSEFTSAVRSSREMPEQERPQANGDSDEDSTYSRCSECADAEDQWLNDQEYAVHSASAEGEDHEDDASGGGDADVDSADRNEGPRQQQSS